MRYECVSGGRSIIKSFQKIYRNCKSAKVQTHTVSFRDLLVMNIVLFNQEFSALLSRLHTISRET